MNIVIMSRSESLYSTRRLKEAGEQRGHNTQVMNYLNSYMNISSEKAHIACKGVDLDNIDAVIPRIGASHTFYGTAVLRQFELMDRFTINRSQAILRSRDKLRSLQIMAERQLGLPKTAFAHSTKDIDGLIKSVGGTPCVIKLLQGTQGVGVILAETKNAAKSSIEAFRGLKENIIIQEFIEEAKGSDLRCFIVGNKIVASMTRKGEEGEFRSNIHRGGKACVAKITKEERTTALRAAQAMGLKVAGVDILRSNRGPLVMEVNSSPGLEGIEKTTGVDVASEIIKFIETSLEQGKSSETKPWQV